jgi:hypothetical protein
MIVWVIGMAAVAMGGGYLVDRFFFGKAGVRGYWLRAILLAVLLGAGIALIFWKMA